MQGNHSYPKILGIHVENLASILTRVDLGEVLDQVDEQLQGFAEGEIGHASEAISSLWRTLTRGGGRNATCDTCSDTVRVLILLESLTLILG